MIYPRSQSLAKVTNEINKLLRVAPLPLEYGLDILRWKPIKGVYLIKSNF